MVCLFVLLLACEAAVSFPFPGGEMEQLSGCAKECAWSEQKIWKKCRGTFVCNSVSCSCRFSFFGMHAIHAICLFEFHPGLNFWDVICAWWYLSTNRYHVYGLVYSRYASHFHNVLPLDRAPLGIPSLLPSNDFDIRSQTSQQQQLPDVSVLRIILNKLQINSYKY